MSKTPKIDYSLRFRKQVMYGFSVAGFIGNSFYLFLAFQLNLITGPQAPVRIATNITILVLWIVLAILTRYNKLTWAGSLFCVVATIGVSASFLNGGLDFYAPVLYFVVVAMAAAYLSPATTAFYGVLCTTLYISISVWLISRLPIAPAEKGVNVALLSLALLALTGLLYGFSRNLGNLLRSSRQKTEELARLNSILQYQRQEDVQIAAQISRLTVLLNEIFEEQNENSQRQATTVSEVATTSQELDAAARKIADNAFSVATVAEKAERSVAIGQQAAYQGVGAIGAMRERVQDISDNMRTLNQQIERISEVTGIIGEIADETNLLALNATIEAAGAGEYGRRFAAVADEVQRLARRSTNAVAQIQEMVQEINQASSKALAATEQGLREAQVGDKLVGGLTVANDDVIHLVAQTSELAANIAGATQQQREASARIVDVMQIIIVAANRLADTGPELGRVLQSLEKACEQLTRVAEQPPTAVGQPSPPRPKKAATGLPAKATRKVDPSSNLPPLAAAKRNGKPAPSALDPEPGAELASKLGR